VVSAPLEALGLGLELLVCRQVEEASRAWRSDAVSLGQALLELLPGLVVDREGFWCCSL
jgi:hypothetical protein